MLDVEYVEAMPEPEEGVTREHDDWVLHTAIPSFCVVLQQLVAWLQVGAISTWADGVVLTGSYDGVARLWQDDQLAGSMPGENCWLMQMDCICTANCCWLQDMRVQ